MDMLLPFFTSEQHLHLGAAGVLVGLSIWLHWKGRKATALAALTLGALVLRLFAIQLDPYLNFWDEVYHAAVARNMVASPFTPKLYTVEAMPIGDHWTNTRIWLHKPPFFLWQMAASISLFGAEPWAVRLPSALWTTALVPLTYRMARTITHDHTTAFMSALATACAFYYQEVVSGALNTDHNDAIFIGAVACSWWAWLEYLDRASRPWAVLAGLFSGAAVLTKWYVGASIFLPWTILLLVHGGNKRSWMDLLAAGGLCMILAASWIIHILLRFPDQALFEWHFKAAHFNSAMDAHQGPWSYHLDIVHELVPPWSTFMVGAALVLLFLKASLQHRIFITSLIAAIHLLFGLAATKMPSYTMVLLPLYLIALAHLVHRAVTFLPVRHHTLLLALAGGVIAFVMMGIERTHHRHTLAEPRQEVQDPRRQQLAMSNVQDLLATYLTDPKRQVLFNLPAPHCIQFMFRTGINTMPGIPEPEVVDRLRRAGFEVVIVQDTMPTDHLPAETTIVNPDILRLPRWYP
jgi:4-amino-4-deoxy-L-arabinose transferase-like glycosyltransferase